MMNHWFRSVRIEQRGSIGTGRLVRMLLPAAIVGYATVLCALSGCGDDSGSGPSGSTGGSAGASGTWGAGGQAGSGGSAGTASYDGGGGSVVGPNGLNCDAFKKLAGDYAPFVDYLSGPAYASFHTDDGSGKPTIYDRNNDGVYCYGDCRKPPTDWAGFGGQVLFAAGAGVSRTRFCWSKNEGHGGKQFAHLYLLRPINQPEKDDGDSWYTSLVDPGVESAGWKQANGGAALAEPLAIGRGKIAWSNNGLVAFRSGLVGAVGTGNSSDDFPFIQLGANKVPTDVAVTNNNEFALVTVWDTSTCKGQVAILALQQRGGYLFGLPNEGFLAGIKLLGYVDLPIAAPTRVSASNDFGLYMSYSSADAVAELSTQAGRDKWQNGADVQHAAAKAGYALIASRDENKVVVLDLEPMFQFYRAMYMTTQENYDKTLSAGPAPEQWPFAFSAAKEATPVVAEVLDSPKPAAVVTGYPVGDRSFSDIDFPKKAYVASIDGALDAYDVGGLAVEGPPTKLVATRHLTIGKNPTRVFNRAGGGRSRDGLVFACRGDRTIHFVDGGGTEQDMLEDSRIMDPVAVTLGDARGASVISIADFDGRKVLNYLDGPIDAWGDQIFGGLGGDGQAAFEFTGQLSFDGRVFGVSGAQVP